MVCHSRDPKITAEFKATEYKGQNKKGVDKSHSFSYNGTSRFDTLREQRGILLQ